MKPLKAVVFDLDDTLFPESTYVISGFRAVGQWLESEHGIDHRKAYNELKTLYDSGVRGNTFDIWLSKKGVRVEVNDMIEVYRSHRPSIELFSEVPPLLVELGESYKMGLMTDGYLRVQRRKCEALRLETFFDVTVFSDSLGRDAWKPDIRPYHVTVTQLGIDPKAAVYVGDNPHKDFLGARRAGLRSIRFQYEDGEYSDAEPPSPPYRADEVITALSQLPEALRGFG